MRFGRLRARAHGNDGTAAAARSGRRFRPRLTTVVALIVLALLAGVKFQEPRDQPRWAQMPRDQLFDAYQRWQPRTPPEDAPVRIVTIDEASLDALGQWPWPRATLARLIEAIGAGGPAAIGLDAIFPEPDRLSPEALARHFAELAPEALDVLRRLPDGDAAFAQAIAAHDVVVARSLSPADQATAGGDGLAQPPSIATLALGDRPFAWVRRPGQFALVGNIPPIEDAAAGHGLINPATAQDGVVRRVPLVVAADGLNPQPALSLEMLRVAYGGRAYLLAGEAFAGQVAGVKEAVIRGVRAGGLDQIRIPTDRRGRVHVHYTRPDIGRSISAADVLAGEVPPETFRQRLVLIGASAQGLGDLRTTPVAASMPGVKVHANLLETVLQAMDVGEGGNAFLQRPPNANVYEVALIVLVGLLLIALVPRLPWWSTLVMAAIAVGGVVGVSLWAYDSQRLLIDGAYPAAAMTVLYLVLALGNYARESAERRQVRQAFGQYLSPALVEQLARDPSRLRLGGERREMTLLFCDVRGFTTLSEAYKDDPAGLTQLINRLLTPLSDAILAHRGTIDKYMGDAIMAFWNAPVAIPDHPAAACRAALAMLAELESLNAARQAECAAAGSAYRPLAIGVGINSGACVVGNVGSRQRFDYSVLGDTVNLASRVEGQSKTYGVAIVVAEDTVAQVEEPLAFLELDLIAVKGKAEAVRIYALLGDSALAAAPAFTELVARQAAMLAAYRRQEWDAAQTRLTEARAAAEAAVGGLTPLYELYDARIAACRHDPPPPDWDGVYRAGEK